TLACVRAQEPKRYDFNPDALYTSLNLNNEPADRFLWVGHGAPGRLRSTDYAQNTAGNINLDNIARLCALTRASKIHINSCDFGYQYQDATNNAWNQKYGLKYLAENIASHWGNATFLLTGTAAEVMLNAGASIDSVFNTKFGQPFYKYEEGNLVDFRQEVAR
ncbi:hypothetical protein K2Q02_02485, partial [Patescibacteria group bacterium]|nr:hypothetical protein [Patescibacteria group bacterium]